MRRVVAALLLAAWVAPAYGKGKPPHRPPPSAPPRADAPAQTKDAAAEPKPGKTKVYTFAGLDVEGKLKTPQLLYFFDRVKTELDTTTQQKRSFMKELEASTSDRGL